jgi:hypothetical protein
LKTARFIARTYCPYFCATQPLVVGAADEVVVVETLVVEAVVPAEVEVTRVVLTFDVELAFVVVGPVEPPLPEHPIRLEAIAMSSYQKVLVAEP